MNTAFEDFKLERDEIRASSAGWAPFLISYGATFIIIGILSFSLLRETTAVIAMFQGVVAFPVAIWLEGRM